MRSVSFILLCLIVQWGAAGSIQTTSESAVARMQKEAESLKPLVRSRLAKEFLIATRLLPAIASRMIYRDAGNQTYLSTVEANLLSEDERKRLTPVQR